MNVGKEDDKYQQELKKNKLRWSDQVENVLISMADKAIVYKVLHEKAYKLNKQKNYAFTIPCVCLSTILASATFALSGDSQMISQQNMVFAQYGLGGVNILIGILQTLQNFFKYAQMSEAHDSVSKQWYKLHRMINTELNIARNKRKDADEFMKYTQLEFDRLIDLSPDVPERIINDFKIKYLKKVDLNSSIVSQDSTTPGGRKKKKVVNEEDLIELPDICGTIVHTRAFRENDKDEVIEEKNDPFDNLVKQITNRMNAATYMLGITNDNDNIDNHNNNNHNNDNHSHNNHSGGGLSMDDNRSISYHSEPGTPMVLNNPDIKIEIPSGSSTPKSIPPPAPILKIDPK